MTLEYDKGVELLKQRAEAVDNLIVYTEMIDIPSVPLDASEDQWEIIKTPLASHHRLVLHALQNMVEGQLLYDPQSLFPVTRATPDGLMLHLSGQTPHAVPFDGGIPDNKVGDPSPKSPKTTESQTDVINAFVENQSLDLSGDLEVIKITGVIPPVYLADLRYHVCKRVMIMMPPGSAKSTYASVVFPTWQMGRRRDQEVILTGWGDPICRRHGKRARTICKSPLFSAIMSSGLDPNTRSAEDWALVNGSSYKSSGINSGVAGFRCDGLVWDDLTKNRKEADSETIRNDVYNAYIDDARSRKKPDAWEVGIGTRWHEDETMGRILPEGYAGESGYVECRDGNVWLIICLAAECERLDDPLGREVGDMIWPEWFGEGYWAEKRVNPRSWGSLYQQRPAPEEGIFFKKEMFKRYEVLPEGDNYFGLDPAVTDEDDNSSADDTVIQAWRVDEFARLYLIEEYCRPVTMDIWIGQMVEMGIRYKPLEICGESGVIRRASEPFIKRAMRVAKAFFMYHWAHRSANKTAMARGAQAMVSSGQVFVPYGQVGDDFIDECIRFPASKKDNRVDAFVNLCMRLENIWEANPAKTVEEEKPIISGGGIPISQLMPARFPKKKSKWRKGTALT